jgi:hypothetical protein
MGNGQQTTRVVIEQRSLLKSGVDGFLQRVATVYFDGREYRVMAPPKAVGDVLDWLEHLSVRVANVSDPFAGSEIDAPAFMKVHAIKAVKEELERLQGEAASSVEFVAGEPYFHVLIHTSKEPKIEAKFDLRRRELEERVLEPYRNLRPIVLGGRTILVQDLGRIQVFESDRSAAEFNEWSLLNARQGVRDWFEGESDLKEVSDDFVTTPSVAALPQNADAIELLCQRFHIVAMQLRDRHGPGDRPTLDIVDEFDVQDLLHALLRIFFEDVRRESWTPSYAGRSSRVDFWLPLEQLVIETKKTRQGLGAKELGDELLIDIGHYKEFQSCNRLICFIYDPDGRVANPRGLERDLSRKEAAFEVKAIVSPRNY